MMTCDVLFFNVPSALLTYMPQNAVASLLIMAINISVAPIFFVPILMIEYLGDEIILRKRLDFFHSKKRCVKILFSRGTNGAEKTSTQTGILYFPWNAER